MADNTLQGGADTIATDDIGGIKYQRVKPAFGVDGVAVDVSATDPLPVGLYGQTVTGTLTAVGSVTIADLRGAATVTLEGIAVGMTAHNAAMEVLTASGVWELAKWLYSVGTSGSIGTPLLLGTLGIGGGANSVRAIADVAGHASVRWRSTAFTGTSFTVTMVTSYSPTTRIGPDIESASPRSINMSTIGGLNLSIASPTSSGASAASGLPVAALSASPNTIEVASSARTATGNSGAVNDSLGGAVSGTLNVTAASGTTPTLDLILQESPDNGTTWVDVYHFERVTAVGVITMPSVPLNGRRRWSWTMTGTTPSFTFSVSVNRGGFAPFPRFVQIFDRTAGLLAGTLNAVSATYQLAGCRGVVAAVTLAAATTPATYKLQGSADGVNWYDMAAAVAGVANATVVLANTGNIHARFGRLLVSVAGATQTGIVVAITGTD